ncbi:MAG: hypothetical protein LBD20_04880 [Spirochaetaceae bacterium]|jgi:hypothetical protein|nr:hypothetical protein [Spirochaetaceae bacterium]
MTERVDLYTLLKSYAQRTKNPVVNVETFTRFLQVSASGENSGKLSDWSIDTRGKVKRALNDLAEQQMIALTEEGSQQTATLLYYYTEIIVSTYMNIDETADVPLPDEKTLKVFLPQDQFRIINVESNLVSYLVDPQTSELPIIKLVFQNSNGAALVLSSLLPFRLLEIAVAKLRDSFRRQGTLEYFSQKLLNKFHGHEPHIKDFIKTFIANPAECIGTILEGGDFSFSVWMFLCQLVRSYVEEQVERVNDRKPAFMAVAQAASLVLAISNYYKVLSMEAKEKEQNFSMLNKKLQEQPYMYTMKDIYGYKTIKGKTLLEAYGEKKVSEYIKTQLNVSEGDTLPELFKFSSDGGEDWIVKREKVIPLCAKLLQEASSTIMLEVKGRWVKKLKDCRTDTTMKYDDEFEDLLEKTTAFFAPALYVIARDKRTAVIQEELGPFSTNEQLFINYKPIPWRTLFHFRRDDILSACRAELPLWYSFKFIVKIVAFFKYGPKAFAGSKKKTTPAKQDDSQSVKQSITNAAKKISQQFLPQGVTALTYLEQLNDRWNQILDKKEREKVTRDVNSIIKNYMSQVLKIQSRYSITEAVIDETAQNIIDLNKSLKNINDRGSLRLYIKTYILQILSDAKF